MFIKPVSEKWFPARVYGADEVIPLGPLPLDPVYVQDVLSFTHEVRCFVLDATILTCSYYRYEGVAWDICGLEPEMLNFDDRVASTPLADFVTEIRARTGNILPRGIVMDFGRLESGDWVLIEFNEAWASGVYHCQPELCFDVIFESQTGTTRQPTM